MLCVCVCRLAFALLLLLNEAVILTIEAADHLNGENLQCHVSNCYLASVEV
jgi:hypothetical protein